MYSVLNTFLEYTYFYISKKNLLHTLFCFFLKFPKTFSVTESPSLVLTPEKIDHWQVKNDLEKFGRNIRLKIDFLNEPDCSFFKVLVFKTPSKSTAIITGTQLELYLSKIEQ